MGKKKVEKKEEVKKSYDWKKGVKKVDKKEPETPKAPEKVQLKKPKLVEKPKDEPQEGVKLKHIPAKEKQEPENKEGIKLKPIPQKEKEDTSHGSNVDKVSKDLARTSNDAKENIKNFQQEKMKNERILAVSELNKIEGNMEDKSIQQPHHNLNYQKVGPVQTNVKRENADSRLKESTGTGIRESSEIKEQCGKDFEVDDKCKQPVQLGIKETTENDIKEKTEFLSIIDVNKNERAKKESDNSRNEKKENNKKVENSQKNIKNVQNNKNDSKKDKNKEDVLSKEVTENEQIHTIVTIKNQDETDIENNKKEESKPISTLNQPTKNKVESKDKSFEETKENAIEKIESINPTEDQVKEEISENVISSNVTRGDEKQKKIKMVKKKKKKALSDNTSEMIQFDELLDTSAPETNESFKVEEPESPSETLMDKEKENQRIINNIDDKNDSLDNLLIPQVNPSESPVEVPSDNEVHVNKAIQTPIQEIPHNKDQPIKKPNINEDVKKPAPKESAPQKISKPKEEKIEAEKSNSDTIIDKYLNKLIVLRR